MVVILLLSSTYSTTNGCDGGSNDSNTSTTSTGETAIPTTANLKARFEVDATTNNSNIKTNSPNTANATKNLLQHAYLQNYDFTATTAPNVSSQNSYAGDVCFAPDYTWRCYISTSPPPTDAICYQSFCADGCFAPHQVHHWQQQRQQRQYAPFNSFSSKLNTTHHQPYSPQFSCNEKSKTFKQFTNTPSTNSSDIVRHVTRVNFYDIDTFQVEFEPKDDDKVCDTEAITKEGEFVFDYLIDHH